MKISCLNLLLRWYCQRLLNGSIGELAADLTSEWGITSLLTVVTSVSTSSCVSLKILLLSCPLKHLCIWAKYCTTYKDLYV